MLTHQYFYAKDFGLFASKSYKYLFWFLFDVAIVNSYILYAYSPAVGRKKNMKEFRLELAVCSVVLLTVCLGEMLVELLLELRNNILLYCFKMMNLMLL